MKTSSLQKFSQYYNVFLPYKFRRYINIYIRNYDYYKNLKCYDDPNNPLNLYFRNKCIFVHIPKTGGSSIKKSVFHNMGMNHLTIRDYKFIFSNIEFNNFFKFAFVRNPWERLVSSYFYLKQGGVHDQDQKWGNLILGKYNSFDNFVKSWVNTNNIYSHVHFMPQYTFICYKNKIAVDFIGKLENFNLDFKYVLEKINIQTNCQHTNRSQHRNYTDYYTDLTTEIVREVYRKDIDLFGYDFIES